MSSIFTLQEKPLFSTCSDKFTYIRCVLWMLLPSLIWSFAFGSIYVCVEPLFFPYLEKRFKSWVSFAIKFVWIFIFLVSILSNWNIRPSSYEFYLFTVLGNSPAPILIICFLFFLVMFFFLYSDAYRKTSLGFRRIEFFIGIFLISLKGILLVLNVGVSEVRNKIITPSPFAIKTLISDNFFNKENSLGKTSEPTFLNHVKSESSMPAKMVLMIVESWGESHGSLVAVEKKLKSRGVKVLKSGFTDYHGSTMQGEIRELCSEYIQFDASTNFSAMADSCAPAYMKNKGYEVFGVHGYQKMFYARDSVWKSLGIDHAYFQPELSKLKTCPGPFRGICDEDMINFGVDLIRQQDMAFLYMLSLSSHEPIASGMPEASVQYFQDMEKIGDSQLVARNAIGFLVDTLSASTELGCTEAYVVGDHQPPSAVNSGQLSEGLVPYIRMSFHCEP